MGRQRAKTLRVYFLATVVAGMSIPNVCAREDLDIHQIWLNYGKYWSGGRLIAKPYDLWCGVVGSGLREVTLTPPGASPIPLEYWGGGAWGFDSDKYATLEDLHTAFPVGNYIFTFNAGEGSVTLFHDPCEPAPSGFPKVTYPTDGAANVPVNLTITWESCAGYGDALNVGLWDENGQTGCGTGFVDIVLTSWEPGPLVPGHLYEIEAGVVDGTATQPYSYTTDQGDSFLYYDLFWHEDTVRFITRLPAIEVAIDIEPQSCPNPLNIESKDLLAVAVLGSEDFDVNAVDVNSIELAGVAPIRSSYEDVAAPVTDGNECECTTEGHDGFLDLTLKFNIEEIVSAVGDVNDGDVLPLTLTGLLLDERPIEGTDCISVIRKGTGDKK